MGQKQAEGINFLEGDINKQAGLWHRYRGLTVSAGDKGSEQIRQADRGQAPCGAGILAGLGGNDSLFFEQAMYFCFAHKDSGLSTE